MLSQPYMGSLDHQVFDNRMDFLIHSKEWCLQNGHQILTGNTGRYVIQNVREDMAEYALKENCDYLMFVDDDMVLPFDTLPRLIKRMEKCDLVSPLAFQRVPPFFPVAYNMKMIEADEEEKKSRNVPNGEKLMKLDFKKITRWPENQLFEVDAIGFGCVLMKTEILRKMPRPWFSSWTTIGEDIFFSHNAHKLGYRVCMDSTFWIGHLADRPVIGRPQFEEFRDHGKVTCWTVGKDKIEEILAQ